MGPRRIYLGLIACGSVAVGVLACNAEATKPLVVGGDSGASSSGGNDGGTTNPDLDGATSKDGSTPKDGAADAPPANPLCGVTLQTSTSSIVAGVQAPFSLSDDELVVAWATGSVPNVVVHYGERAKKTDPFVEKGSLDSTDGTFALDRPVLEARGFDLGMVDVGRQTWHLFSRQARGDTFVRSQKNIFQQLIVFANALAPGELLHDPVWADSGRSMLFGVATKGIYRSDAILGGDDFDVPQVFSARAELKPVGANRRRPSGLSGDGLTFLFFDEVSGQSVAATRTTGDFTTFANLGTISDVKTGLGCKAIYFSDGSAVRVAAQP